MDNASRALVMAGGVFIAIAIISVAVYAITVGRGFAVNSEALLTASQIQSFNRFYTTYNSLGTPQKEVRCIDAINILNRAVEDGIPDANITVGVSEIVKSGNVYTVSGGNTNLYLNTVKFGFRTNEVGQVATIEITN